MPNETPTEYHIAASYPSYRQNRTPEHPSPYPYPRLTRTRPEGTLRQPPGPGGDNGLMVRDANELTVNPRAVLRHGATAVAVARVALGVAALARPSVPARPWVGEPADEIGLQVLGRALGARDLALGLGTLAAAGESLAAGGKPPAGPWPAAAWYAAGALSDALDLTITVTAWPRLPRATRWLVAASAGGAALAGAAGALTLILERAADNR
jgi:hypothetical protein